ncbi:hypothetical protein NEDG_01943 [Nematocida displodere]|uniref:Uncharacterized protein n=1 Tax=Nematocida displodere TaxID=1805483 RepID=A0A177EI66_9MICR|nr:hypothetical protein NEDG_01943 [Nematocida displodere]
MVQEEKSSLIRMLNTSIGNISGLFKSKKEEPGPEVEVEDINNIEEKEAHSLLLDNEDDFEKELSQLSLSLEEPPKADSLPELAEESEPEDKKTETEEILRLRKILSLKEEIRAREKDKEEEKIELKALELVKVQAQLEYEKKQRKILEQEIAELKERLEKNELECMELIKYCQLLLGPGQV